MNVYRIDDDLNLIINGIDTGVNTKQFIRAFFKHTGTITDELDIIVNQFPQEVRATIGKGLHQMAYTMLDLTRMYTIDFDNAKIQKSDNNNNVIDEFYLLSWDVNKPKDAIAEAIKHFQSKDPLEKQCIGYTLMRWVDHRSGTERINIHG